MRILGTLGTLLYAAALLASPRTLALEEKQTIQKTFELTDPTASAQLEIDNLFGSIEVVGHAGRRVEVVAVRTDQAETSQKMQLARQEVKLDMAQSGNSVRLYVDGPFRCNCAEGSTNFLGWREQGYRVRFDFQVRVPQQSDVDVKTVNEGHIKIENVSGHYQARNVNGGIEMLEVAGYGRASTINGPLKVLFRKNPEKDSFFGAFNRDVELHFQPGLVADFRVKTFNGRTYTDFEVESLPPRPPSEQRREGKFVYRSDKHTGFRIGRGGVQIELDGFNGDFRILKR